MKAIDLIKILEKEVEKYGENIDVFIEAPGYNCEDTYSIKNEINMGLSVEDVSLYEKSLIWEYWDADGEITGQGSGYIKGVVLIGDTLIEHYG